MDLETFMQCLSIGAPVIIILVWDRVQKRRQRIRRDAELERWRAYWSQADRWLAEFPDAVDALAYLKARANGEEGLDIQELRKAMRVRRDFIKKP